MAVINVASHEMPNASLEIDVDSQEGWALADGHQFTLSDVYEGGAEKKSAAFGDE